jgi:predicted RNase H-like HicB family nuclease
MKLTIESEVETDGRWIAEIPQISGALAYGSTRDEAMRAAQVLALRILSDRLEHGEAEPSDVAQLSFEAA